jgi:hypothetical protein
MVVSGWPDRTRGRLAIGCPPIVNRLLVPFIRSGTAASRRYPATGRDGFGLLAGLGGLSCSTSGRHRKAACSGRRWLAGEVLAGMVVCPTLGLSLKGYPELAGTPKEVHISWLLARRAPNGCSYLRR